MKNSGLIGLIVANNGLGLRTALESQYDITELKHVGDFVFRAELKDQTSLEIQTKPVELAAFHIRIVSIKKLEKST